MKFNVIGFSKCGTTALTSYLNSVGHEAVQNEFLIYKKDGYSTHNEKYPDYTPIAIKRDIADKLWSEYHYRPVFREMKLSFEEFLDFDDERWSGVGLYKPIKLNYDYYIQQWEKESGKKLLVLNLEEIKDVMPKLNESNCPKMPEDVRNMVYRRNMEIVI